MIVIMRLLAAALAILEYVLPLVGKLLEGQRRTKQGVAVLQTVVEAERLLARYKIAKADGRLTPPEIEWIIQQINVLVASLREVVKP